MSLRLLAPLTLAALVLVSSAAAFGGDHGGTPRAPVKVVDVRGASALVARGAVVLDARDAGAFMAGHIPGAQMYAWQRFTGEGASRGRVRSDLRSVAQALSRMGVDTGRSVLVYGDTGGGSGEEGQAGWLLALLGHPDVSLLDGGFHAWRNAGRPVVTSTSVLRPGTFDMRPRPELRADRDYARRATQLLDVRTAAEFSGATPYGEARGGHLPGARHLDWRVFLDESGRLRSPARVQRSLSDAGLDPAREIVTYCSGGPRSAFAAVALASRGIARVRNYDGGLSDWASDPSLPVVR